MISLVAMVAAASAVKATARLQPVGTEPVVGLGDPEAAAVAGRFGLGRVVLDGRQGLVGFENDSNVYVAHRYSPGNRFRFD